MKYENDLDKSIKSKRRQVEEENQKLYKLREETNFEKGDYLALIVAALTTILPVVLVMLALYYIITMFFFG